MRKINIIFLVILLAFAMIGFSNDPFSKVKTLTEVIRLVQEGYFEDVDMNKGLEGAIRGFLETLDPHSQYISNEELKNVASSQQDAPITSASYS